MTFSWPTHVMRWNNAKIAQIPYHNTFTWIHPANVYSYIFSIHKKVMEVPLSDPILIGMLKTTAIFCSWMTLKIMFCSGNMTFYLLLGVPTPHFSKKSRSGSGGPGGVPGVARVQNGVKSRVCSVNPIFSGSGTPKIRGPGGVPRGQKGGKIKGLFRKQPFFGVLGGSRGSGGPQNDPFMTQ